MSETTNGIQMKSSPSISVRKNLTKITKKAIAKDKKFICVMCEQSFSSHNILKQHFMKHGGSEIDIRGRPIENSTFLKHPRQDTITLQLIPCEFCPEVLPNLSKAIQHKFRKHRLEGKNHFCEFCGKLFPILVALEQHKITTKCGEEHKNKNSVDGHHPSNIQHRTETHKCSFCSVTFATHHAVIFHENCVHKFEKSLLVPSFIPPPSKKIKMSNSNEVFSVYYCHLCGSEYISKYNLKKHIQNHHKEEERNHIPENGIIKCKTCDGIFYNQKAYSAHNIHHKPGDLYVTSEEQRQQVVARVDLDFDIRRIPHPDARTERRRKAVVKIPLPSTSIKKEVNNDNDSDNAPLSPPSPPSSSDDEEAHHDSKDLPSTNVNNSKNK